MSSPPSGYDTASANCTANNQSPVDLSRLDVKNCERACDFSVDAIETQSATVAVDNNKMLMTLTNLSPPPTATYNNIRYACNKIELYRMPWHSYDGTYIGTLELVAHFTSPGYTAVLMSVPVNSSAATDTPSTKFFNAFVGYVNSVSLRNSWSLQNAVPSDMSYFVYAGRSFTCETKCTWIVYNNAIQINNNNYENVKNVLTTQWRKEPQQLSAPGSANERHVYFRNATQENPAYSKKDGKVYMKCRRLNTQGQVAGEEGFDNMREGFFGGSIEGLDNPGPGPAPVEAPTVRSGGLTGAQKKKKDAETAVTGKNIRMMFYNFYLQLGGIWGILLIVAATAFAILLNTLWSKTLNEMFDWAMSVPNFFHEFLLANPSSSSSSKSLSSKSAS
jgi:carbonic anhydrase